MKVADTKTMYIEFAKLHCSVDYQRGKQDRIVNAIVKDFDPACVGTILVGQREDGTFHVVDGQQRCTAMVERGIDGWMCSVFKSQGEKHEAEVFSKVNKTRKQLTEYELFRADLVKRCQVALEVKRIVEKHGFRVGKTQRKKTFACCSKMRGWVKDNPELFEDCVKFISEVWEDDDRTKPNVIGGLFHFCKVWGDHENFNRKRLLNVCQRDTTNARTLIQWGKAILALDLESNVNGSAQARHVSQGILAKYNRNLSKAKQLIA